MMEPEEWLGLGIVGFLLIVVVMAIHLVIWPARYYDPNFTSRSLTGWSNTPKKLAWSRTIEKVANEKVV